MLPKIVLNSVFFFFLLIAIPEIGTPIDESIHQTNLIALKEGWTYRWQDFPSGGTLTQIPPQHWSEEIEWKATSSPLNPPERKGRKILWLKIKLPERSFRDPALLIDRRGVLLTFEAYLNGDRIYRFGKLSGPGSGHYSGITSHLFSLKEDFSGRTLFLNIFSDYQSIGVRGKVLIGEKAELLRYTIDEDVGRLIVGLLILFIGIVGFFGFSEISRREMDIPFFGVYAICVGAYTVHITTIKDIVFYAPLFWSHIYILALTIMPVGIIGFVWQNFRPERGNFLHRLWQIHVLYAVCSFGAYLVALYSWIPTNIGYALINILRWVFVFETIFLLWIVAHTASARKNMEAKIYLLGLISLAVFGIQDLLVALRGAEDAGSHIHWGLLLFILSLGWIQRRRYVEIQKRIRTYSRDLERKSEEKETLLKNLHDGIGGLITNIHLLAEMARNSGKLNEMKQKAETIAQLASDALSELKNFMFSIDEKEADWSSLISELRYHGQNMIESHGLTYKLDASVQQGAPRPGSLFYLNLFKIHKEALTNVIKHAKASRVDVELRAGIAGLTTFAVKDDGIGLCGNERKGRGIQNMKKRAREIGGELTVSHENGTSIKLTSFYLAREKQYA